MTGRAMYLFGRNTWPSDLFFFFFQAEDGIRDGRVTGVQTCALPISVRSTRPAFCKVCAPHEYAAGQLACAFSVPPPAAQWTFADAGGEFSAKKADAA